MCLVLSNILELGFFTGIALFFLLLVYFSLTRENWTSKEYMGILRAFLFLCFVWTAGAVVMYLLEFRYNQFFSSVSESFWSIATYLLSGFEDRGPNTGPGKVAAVGVMIGGVSVVAYLTGELAAFLTAKKIQRRTVMSKGDRLIINWGPKGDRLIRQINAYYQDAGIGHPSITVLTRDKVNADSLSRLPDYKKVTFVQGDAFDKGFLRSISAHRASDIIILGEEDDPETDAKNALITLGLRSLAKQEGTNPYIIVEVVNPRKSEHIKDAGADEVVCFGDYEMGLLAQTSLHHGTSDVYLDLLTANSEHEDCEIYMVEQVGQDTWNRFFKGKSFKQTAVEFLNQNPPVILIGLRRKGQVVLNPVDQEFTRWQEGDVPIFVAYDQPKL